MYFMNVFVKVCFTAKVGVAVVAGEAFFFQGVDRLAFDRPVLRKRVKTLTMLLKSLQAEE